MTDKTFDAVVIGAGNSGIAAAIRLEQAGLKTLLLEKHNLPGGCSTSFTRGRFEFDATLHEFCNYGPEDDKGDSRILLEELGLDNEWVAVPDCYRVIFDKDSTGEKMDVWMPIGVDAYIDAIEKEVPGSRESVRKLFDLIDEMSAAVAYINSTGGNADASVLKKEYPDFLRTAAYSTKDVFRALKIPKRAQDILSVYWTYLGQPLDTMAFLHYGMGIQQYINKGPYIPKLTSHCTSTDLMERFYALGGEAWFHCKAEKIDVRDGKVVGVLTDRRYVKTRIVIGNLNPHMVFGKMIEESEVPAREKKLASKRDFGFRFFNVYLGLDKPPEELGLQDYSIFLSDTSDSRAEYEKMKAVDTNDYAIFNCYNIANPDASPEGTSLCTITAMFSDDAWADVSPDDYRKVKEDYADYLIDLCEKKLGVKLRDSIEEIEIATPLTFARYLGTPQGTAYGYQTNLWDSMMARLMSLGEDHTIEGLYLAGAAGPRGHGNNIGYVVGDTMAKSAIRDMENGDIK